jgi:hypothetical protein
VKHRFADVADQKGLARAQRDDTGEGRLGRGVAVDDELDRRYRLADVVGDVAARGRGLRQQDGRGDGGERCPPEPSAKMDDQNECLTRNSSA